MIHSCNPSPPLPRGLSRLCSGPAPNPSREIEKLSTLSLLNVASYLAMLFDAQQGMQHVVCHGGTWSAGRWSTPPRAGYDAAVTLWRLDRSCGNPAAQQPLIGCASSYIAATRLASADSAT